MLKGIIEKFLALAMFCFIILIIPSFDNVLSFQVATQVVWEEEEGEVQMDERTRRVERREEN